MSNEPENTRPQGSARLPNGRFAPGVSPNPGGRPKGLAELQELARSHSATAIARLAYIAEHGKSEQAQIAACIALLDRGYGKPTQPMAAIIRPRRFSTASTSPRRKPVRNGSPVKKKNGMSGNLCIRPHLAAYAEIPH